MAEGLSRHFLCDTIQPYSAGIEKHGLNPLAVKVMSEINIDISGQKSKTTGELKDKDFDYVVTVCGYANESCPFFPANTKVIHSGFDDPPQVAAGAKIEEEALTHYRRVRNEITRYILTLPALLNAEQAASVDAKKPAQLS